MYFISMVTIVNHAPVPWKHIKNIPLGIQNSIWKNRINISIVQIC